MITLLTPSSNTATLCILLKCLRMDRFKTQVQMGIVFDMLSGNLFPFLVESTIKHPPFCPTHSIKITKLQDCQQLSPTLKSQITLEATKKKINNKNPSSQLKI